MQLCEKKFIIKIILVYISIYLIMDICIIL